MAERRMFAKTIVLSDEFLDMPLTARCLYFTLGMLADDDGFVNAPKSIMRQCGASLDDMKLLISKKFVLDFESGVIVIKHWRINNYLRNDRYTETKYVEEKSQLEITENGSYSFGIPSIGIPSIDKDRIGKDSIDKDIYTQECDDIFYQYNSICKSLPRANKLTDQRKTHIKARLKKYTKAEIVKCFEMAEASDFLTGKTKNKFVASFDWLINENNLNKVLEGNYANRKSNNSNFEQRDDDFDAIAEAIMMNQEKL